MIDTQTTDQLPVSGWEDQRTGPDLPQDAVHLSVVIPVLNEGDSLQMLHEDLARVLEDLGRSYEVVFVDDGSTDHTFEVLGDLARGDDHLRVVRLRRNFGQTAALSAGFDHARGEVIVTMDGDLQNDPGDIPRLLLKIDEGYDVVSGWRVDRKDPFLTRRLPSQIANRLISIITGVKLHDYGCSLKAYRREVVKNIRLYGEMHRFIPALASWMGIQVAEIPVNHAARRFGQSKYGLKRAIKVVLDLLTVKFLLDYATRPIQIFGLLGMLCLSVGTALGVYLSTLKLVFHQAIGDRPLLLLAILLMVLGVQLITMGLLGEMVVRTYHEAQDKPIYMLKETLGAGVPKRAGRPDVVPVRKEPA